METHARPKSFEYDVRVRWTGEKRGVLSTPDRPDLEVASPPEFRGHPGTWTPEHMFVGAVNLCTMLTFLAFAGRKGLRLVSYESDGHGTLEMADGRLRFTRVVLRPRIVIAAGDDVETARALFHEAEQACLVTNSIRAQVEAQPEITAG